MIPDKPHFDEKVSIASVGHIVGSTFSDPEALLYLTRHLARLNQVDASLELLERVVQGGHFCLPAISSDAWLDPLREGPKFVRLLENIERQHQFAAREFDRLDGIRILGITTRASGR